MGKFENLWKFGKLEKLEKIRGFLEDFGNFCGI
jgi:hypothetical protein